MPSIKRRKFLQFVGASTLTSLGLSHVDIQLHGDRDSRVFARSIPRKLALLVGINTYRDRTRFAPLKGCLTDVEMHRQLLIHRFGFNPQDILTLTEDRATRQNILEAFEAHLIQQAQPGDVVVVHFSGYGSQAIDPQSDSPDRLDNTLVPVDSSLQPDNSVAEISGKTLWLLMAALNTDNVTMVIDASHAGSLLSGDERPFSGRIESGKTRSGRPPQLSDRESTYQQQWLRRLGLSHSDLIERRRTGIAKGMVLAASRGGQLAAEGVFDDNICAGTFTYLMTQYLWQRTGTEWARSAIANITRGVTPLSSTAQQPELLVPPNSGNEKRPIYFLEPQTPPAEASIAQVQGETVTLWLGGIEPQSLKAFSRGAILTLVDRIGREQGLVQLESRQGLVGSGKVLKATPHAVQVGALLQERIRSIPDNLTLRLALDPSLGSNLSEVEQALKSIKFIEVLPLEQNEIEYTLGRITISDRQSLQPVKGAESPEVGSIGLFLPRRVQVPGSFGGSSETVIDAVRRLQPKFKSLLATRIVQLALNPNSSRLNIKAWMTPEDNQGILAQTFTLRGSNSRTAPEQSVAVNANASGEALVLPMETRVQLHIANYEPRDLYCSILVIDPTREMSVIFPNQWAATEDVTRVKAGQTLLIPNPSKDAFALVTQEPKGVTEVLIIASNQPLRETLLSLRAIALRGGQRGGPIALSAPDDPMEVVTNLLHDLDASDRSSPDLATSYPGVHRLDTTELAVLSIPFEVT